MDAEEERVEVEPGLRAGDHDLAIEHEPGIRPADGAHRRLELRKVAVERLEVPRLDVHLRAITEDEGPEAVPFRLIDPFVALGYGCRRLGEHGRDGRFEGKGHGADDTARHGIIHDVRDLGRRLLIGLAVLAAGTMAVGYGFIFSGIATPPGGDRGVVPLPTDGQVIATLLDDGRPVFVVEQSNGEPWVVDAQVPGTRSRLGFLVGWCPASRAFVDPARGSIFSASGEVLSGPAGTGLTALATRSDAGRLIVGSEARVQGRSPLAPPADGACEPDTWVVHRPAPGEVFDPSVAADLQPPGWVWIEGSLQVADGEVRLCDGLDGACDDYAAVIGIDPASVVGSDRYTVGLFFGRVNDGDIEGLARVPQYEEGS